MLKSFMRPYTPHYVLTVQHSITYKRNFYAKSTIRESCRAIIHHGIGSLVSMKTDYIRTSQLLRRILLWSLQEYERVVTRSVKSHFGRCRSMNVL
jgi:hypothetical protein